MPNNKNTYTTEQKLQLLRENYQSKLPSEMLILQTLAESLGHEEQDRNTLDELRHRLHKLAGSGSTFGLVELSEQAKKLELEVNAWLNNTALAINEEAQKSFLQAVIALQDTLDQKVTPHAPIVYNAMGASSKQDKKTVWLIEDDSNLAKELSLQLESFGFIVKWFSLAADAEHASHNEQPDLLLLDVILAKENIDTTELLSLLPGLRELRCPVVFISAHDDFHSRLRAAQLGAQGYFIKPLDIPHLVNRLVQILEQEQAEPPRVMIIDDDITLARHYQLTLLGAGMEVKILQRPETLIEEISAFRPELILMDLHMPDYSGHDLAGVIRQHENWSNIPIVYLSAETDPALQIQALERGADDFQTKPISDIQLIASVTVRVERARLLTAQINRDSLTGLLKHASIKEEAELALIRSRRSQTPVAIVMLNIDHFKRVNDNYGHAMGDVVISSLAMLLRQQLRQSDIIGRYGGEEFVAVLVDCDVDSALQIINKLRLHFSSLRFTHGGTEFSCTFSAGIACSTDFPNENAVALIALADEALYTSKRNGRNQVNAKLAP